ncbi:diguanylate cyclase [Desulfitobacterium metallireducens DSM 15288]|uniref:Diguanylate cyclase n=2 Tax=Desulfitobacterium TaxID=36853 RepID=W0EEZ9_9FIRM|nr:diguanylate cyclase [Desulfitobacterium metallireducens DSM 15288]
MANEDIILLQQNVPTLRAEGKYKECIEESYQLLERAMPFKDYKSMLIAYYNQSASYYSIGEIELAFSSLDTYNEICQQHGDEADLLNSYNLWFVLYECSKDYEEAKKMLEESIKLAKRLKKYNVVANAYANYSHLDMIDEDYCKALEMAQIGLAMAKLHQPAKPILELRIKLNMVKALIGLNDFGHSKSLIDEMIENPLLDSFIREKAECYDLLGHLYSNMKIYRDAFEAFTQAKTLVESYNDVYLLKSIQEQRCKLCDQLADYNLGYSVQKEYIALLKEISRRELALTALRIQLKHNIASIIKKANTDYLTGLYNRNYIETTTTCWLEQASENKESLCCMVFDIDGFKSINDKYGHLYGDEILKHISKACSSMIRETDILGRYGGDEFVIILRGVSLEKGKIRAKQILEKVRSLVIVQNGKQCQVTISIGVTDNLNRTCLNFKEIFMIADRRLYKAKRNGKNKICAWD